MDETDIAALPFEQALKRLEDIVRQLERGEVSLEDSITLYQQGEALKRQCEQKLKAAQDKIEAIQLAADGSVAGTRPFDGNPR
jgi:exodeoxyribonuclease VII small subunit